MAQYQTRPARALDKVDPVWARIRSEAEDVARREPELATFIYENILHHDTLEAARGSTTPTSPLTSFVRPITMRWMIGRRSARRFAPTSSPRSTAIRRPAVS